MPGCALAAGTASSRTGLPVASVIFSVTFDSAFLKYRLMTASVGGFSPSQYWCAQNSSLRSSHCFHCSAGSIEKSLASAAPVWAAVYSWIGDR